MITRAGARCVVILVAVISLALLGSFTERAATHEQKPLSLGMIGLDTSHALRFTELLNDPS